MNIQHSIRPYLIFQLGLERFAVGIDNVQEVVEVDQITKVPNVASYMLGIINLRGRVLPLFDTKLKLGLPKTELTRKSRIIIIELKSDDKMVEVGALVDAAKEVVEIGTNEIQNPPEMESGKTSEAISGIVNNDGEITMVIDIQKIFTLHEILQIK